MSRYSDRGYSTFKEQLKLQTYLARIATCGTVYSVTKVVHSICKIKKFRLALFSIEISRADNNFTILSLLISEILGDAW